MADAEMVQRTVLFIEDNAANAQLVEAVLAGRPDVRLQIASSGDAGIAFAREQRPVVVLVDTNLPDLPTDAILETLRAHPRTRDIPVVIFTAEDISGQLERLLSVIDDLTGDRHQPIEVPYFRTVVGLDRGEKARAGELVGLFVEDTAAKLHELRRAAADGEHRSVEAVAHRLKGSAASFGAHRLSALCAAIEGAPADRTLVGACVAAAAAEFIRVRDQLGRLLAAER